MNSEITEHTLRAAAAWHARLSAPDCSEKDAASFARWRDADPMHASAWRRVDCGAARVARLMQNDPRLQAMADDALANAALDRPTRLHIRSRWAVGAAAGVLIALASLRFVPALYVTDSPALAYVTAPGETRMIQLEDGSTVHLDTDSAIDVQMNEQQRSVALRTGRAFFRVAKDPRRRFVVQADNVSTTALGTEFQVSRGAAEVTVTLAEGRVEVSDPARQHWAEVLEPGNEMRISGAERVHRRVSVARIADWSRGRHEFEHTPLAAAIAEINRYSRVKLRLGEPSIGQLELGGSFLVGDSDHIVAAITAALPVRAVQAGAEILLFPRYDVATH